MAINFPNSPVENDTFTVDNKTFVFDGTTWIVNSFVGYTGSAGPSTISGLTDVTIASAATNDNLRYSGSSWVNEPEIKENFLNIGTGSTINCSTGNVFASTPNGNITYTFSNPPATGTAYGFTLKITPSATIAITWPASVTWAGGTAPEAPASGETDVYAFFTHDGGTTWYGFQSGDAMA